MGEKGAKLKAESTQTAESLVQKLAGLGNINSKKMFGGHGLFCDDKMFCIVDSKGQSFFKGDDKLKSELESQGGFKHGRMPYYSIPDSVLNSNSELIRYATKAIEIAK
ncbi:MAG: TfoX/Sxy family protein [Cytophagales bacterium]